METIQPYPVIDEPRMLIETINEYVKNSDGRQKPLLIWFKDAWDRMELIYYFGNSNIPLMDVPIYGHDYAFINDNPVAVRIKDHPELFGGFQLPSSYTDGVVGFYYRESTKAIFDNTAYLQTLVDIGFAVICSSSGEPEPPNDSFYNILFDSKFPLLISGGRLLPSLDDWISWWKEQGFLPIIAEYLVQNPDDFYKPDAMPRIVPNTWLNVEEHLHNMLKCRETDSLRAIDQKHGFQRTYYKCIGDIPDDILYNEIKPLGEAVGNRFIDFVRRESTI